MTGAALPGQFVLNMLLMEYVGHAWDLATALGREPVHSGEEAAVALSAARSIIRPEHRGTMFGPATVVPTNAGPLERLMAFLGRDVV